MRTEINKVLIFAPRDKAELTAAIPFFHVLRERYPDAGYQVMVSKETEKYILSISDTIETFIYDDKELGLPGIHKYAVNKDEIFNIDLFIDLESTLKSSFLGFSFRSKERIGFEKGMNKFLLTHRVLPIDSYRPDRKYLGLLESFFASSFKDIKVDGSSRVEMEKEKNKEELEKLPPYFLIHTDRLLEEKEFWNDFFRFFDDQYFVIWFEPSLGEGKLEETNQFIKSFGEENKFELRTGSEELFLKLLLHSEIYLGTDLIWTCFANYFGLNTYCLVSKVTDIPFMEHFKNTPTLIEWKEGIPSKWVAEEGSQPIGTVDKLVNLFYEKHEL